MLKVTGLNSMPTNHREVVHLPGSCRGKVVNNIIVSKKKLFERRKLSLPLYKARTRRFKARTGDFMRLIKLSPILCSILAFDRLINLSGECSRSDSGKSWILM